MKITQIIQGVHNPSAGPTYSVARMADELGRLGLKSSILTLGNPPAEWPHEAELKVYSGHLERLLGISPALMRDLRRQSAHPSILHGHSVWRLVNLFPLFLHRAPAARIVCSPRGALSAWSMRYKRHIKSPFWHTLQKPALTLCHCFHVTSEQEYEDVRKLGFRNPVAIVPNGIDIPRLAEPTARSKTVLYLSRIDPVKGIDTLLGAWDSVCREFPEWRLVVAGPLNNEYAERMQEQTRHSRIPRLSFYGEALGNDKTRLFSRASLFILPSHSENFGVAVAEAFAHGLPVITTTGTPWNLITKKRCGWYIPPNPDSLADSLRAALSRSPDELNEMGMRGHRWMRDEYSWTRAAALMQKTYQWLLSKAPRPNNVILE